MKHVICVPEQMVIDGNFPTVASPTRRTRRASIWRVDLAKANDADFILGSDPDADRVGIMVRTKDDDFVVISGNQTGVLLLDYLIGAKRRTGKMPENPVALKTIVTTEMARKVAEVNGLKCYDTFTGFKFLAEKKDKLESSGEGRSSSPMRSPMAICWATMSGTRTPFPPAWNSLRWPPGTPARA